MGKVSLRPCGGRPGEAGYNHNYTITGKGRYDWGIKIPGLAKTLERPWGVGYKDGDFFLKIEKY